MFDSRLYLLTPRDSVSSWIEPVARTFTITQNALSIAQDVYNVPQGRIFIPAQFAYRQIAGLANGCSGVSLFHFTSNGLDNLTWGTLNTGGLTINSGNVSFSRGLMLRLPGMLQVVATFNSAHPDNTLAFTLYGYTVPYGNTNLG